MVAKHHAVWPRIFGSIARGDDKPGSDVNLLAEFTDGASLFDEMGLRLALADLLRFDVDVVPADPLRGLVTRLRAYLVETVIPGAQLMSNVDFSSRDPCRRCTPTTLLSSSASKISTRSDNF